MIASLRRLLPGRHTSSTKQLRSSCARRANPVFHRSQQEIGSSGRHASGIDTESFQMLQNTGAIPSGVPAPSANQDGADVEQVEWSIEDENKPSESLGRARFAAVVTLSLSTLGSSVLPLPFAFSKTGVLLGLLIMAVVAYSNDLTSKMLVEAAAFTGKPSYESLAESVGGKSWKMVTRASLILLLFGTMCGAMTVLSDCGQLLVQQAFTEPPEFLANHHQLPFLAVVVFVLYPLCLQRHMRQLENVATCGVAIVFVLAGILCHSAYQLGFPALMSGDLPLFSLKVDKNLPEAFAVMGYAFYMQPMMMPLLQEMPPPPSGVKVMRDAVSVTLFGVATFLYGSIGIAGASIYGQATDGNVLVKLDELVHGHTQRLVLYVCMLLYLTVSLTTTQFALRVSVDALCFGDDAPYTWPRQVLMTTLTMGGSLAVALLFPRCSEKIFAVTGATGVCVVCYLIPVCIHFKLYAQRKLRQAANQSAEGALQPLLGDTPTTCNDASLYHKSMPEGWMPCCLEWCGQVLMPIVVLALGTGFSMAALWAAMSN